MSDLSKTEKRRFEKLFDMESGYVMDFSNRTIEDFVEESVGIDIYDDKYVGRSGSKANRLRTFWEKEPNHVVGKLLGDLLDHCKTWVAGEIGGRFADTYSSLIDDCRKTVARLKESLPVEDIEAIRPMDDDPGLEALVRDIRENIGRNSPEIGLDRLHTYVVKRVRKLCEKHDIEYDRKKALHALFGEYVKALREKGAVESKMAADILKATVKLLDQFNYVRNNQSLAHDNVVLSYEESLLIINYIASSMRFIDTIEEKIEANKPDEVGEFDSPF